MQSNAVRLALVLVAVAIAAGLFVVLSDDDEEAAPAPKVPTGVQGELKGEPSGDGAKPKPDKPEVATIEVRGGQPVGGVQELSFESGDQVEFTVESDIAEHVHVHGYDVIQDVEAGESVTFEFPAEIEGLFEVELEDSHVQIAELEVSPG